MAIKLTTSPTLTQALQASTLLNSLDRYYPDINHWYVNKVIPGIYTGDDKILLATEGQHVVGIALGKTGEETKLRCIRVVPEYQGSGLGIRIIDRMLDVLEDPAPHVTVSEELIHQYSRMFVNRYGFKLNEVGKGLYRPGKLEYCFN